MLYEVITERVDRDKYLGVDELNQILKEEIAALLEENNTEDVADFELPERSDPYVIMVVGVNGVGKTTTIGKLAWNFKQAGKKVVLGAADTFRAAAIDQLQIVITSYSIHYTKLYDERYHQPGSSYGRNRFRNNFV